MTKRAITFVSPAPLQRRATMCLTALVILFSAPLSHATKLYKWVDANGTISYQDRPPPKNAKILEEREMNPQRRVPIVTAPDPVIVYTVDDCQRCVEVLKWLENIGVPAEARALKDDRDAQRRILDLSNGLTVPTLFIDQQIVTDSSEESMISALLEADYQLNLPESDGTEQAAETPTANTEPQLSENPLDVLDTSEVDNAELSDDELLEQLSEFEPSEAFIDEQAVDDTQPQIDPTSLTPVATPTPSPTISSPITTPTSESDSPSAVVE